MGNVRARGQRKVQIVRVEVNDVERVGLAEDLVRQTAESGVFRDGASLNRESMALWGTVFRARFDGISFVDVHAV